MINVIVQLLVAAWLIFQYRTDSALTMAGVLTLNAIMVLINRTPGEKKAWEPPAAGFGQAPAYRPSRPPPVAKVSGQVPPFRPPRGRSAVNEEQYRPQ